MSLHIVNDKNGMPSGIFIPINEWEEIKNKYSINDINLTFNNKNDLTESLKQALLEVSLIENGKLAKKSAFNLLEEL